MAPWSTEIMESFTNTQPELEPDFTPAAYNKLLHTLFPVNTPYAVFPGPHAAAAVQGTRRTTFTVYHKHTPVFVLDVHAYKGLGRVSAREEADRGMKRDMRDLVGYCALGMLHGVSAFGTRLRFYTATGVEGMISAGDWWDCDVLDDDGAIRLKEVVNRIRNHE